MSERLDTIYGTHIFNQYIELEIDSTFTFLEKNQSACVLTTYTIKGHFEFSDCDIVLLIDSMHYKDEFLSKKEIIIDQELLPNSELYKRYLEISFWKEPILQVRVIDNNILLIPNYNTEAFSNSPMRKNENGSYEFDYPILTKIQ